MHRSQVEWCTEEFSILLIFRSLTINQKSFSTATRNESVLDLVQETETQDYPIWLLQTNPTKVSVKKHHVYIPWKHLIVFQTCRQPWHLFEVSSRTIREIRYAGRYGIYTLKLLLPLEASPAAQTHGPFGQASGLVVITVNCEATFGKDVWLVIAENFQARTLARVAVSRRHNDWDRVDRPDGRSRPSGTHFLQLWWNLRSTRNLVMAHHAHREERPPTSHFSKSTGLRTFLSHILQVQSVWKTLCTASFWHAPADLDLIQAYDGLSRCPWHVRRDVLDFLVRQNFRSALPPEFGRHFTARCATRLRLRR